MTAPLKIEVVPIASITPDPDNAKIHTAEQIDDIVESIKAYGFNDPIGICGAMIVEGEGRWLALKQMGSTEAPVIRLDHLNEAQRRAYALAHNHLNAKTGLDPIKLRLNLTAIKVAGLELKPIGFTPLDLKKIFADPKKESDDAADEAAANADDESFAAFSERGDLWVLGNHRLLCGDATSADDIARVMGEKQADLVLTDPPYNVAYTGKTSEALTIENDKMDNATFRDFLFKFYKCAIDATKPGGALYVFHADLEGYNFRGAMVDAGWMMKQCLVWAKDRFALGRHDYHYQHEPCLYGWKPGAAHNWFSDRTQTTILKFNRPSRNIEHPTMKSVDLIEYLMKNSSDIDQIVLDPFGGSGTTMIAAEQTGRLCYTVELSPRYVSVIVNRWMKLTKMAPVLHRNGSVMSLEEAKAVATKK